MRTTCEKIQEATRSRWLARWGEKPKATIRLFCFPFAGGSTNTYRVWQGLLPEPIDVVAVQLPGRGERLSESPFQRLSEIVEALGRELIPYFDKPFAFFGHSMGALISFELTQWLRKHHQTMPSHLFVSGHRAPQVPKAIAPTWDLPEPEFIERVRELNGTPQEVLDNPELMQLMIPLLRADFAVCETYEYQPQSVLDCCLTVFGGVGDLESPYEHLTPWREQTSAPYKLHMLPGDHFFVQTAHVEITRIIAAELEKVGKMRALN
ncbi:MAG TPA: alpha/beta fold hydrolase [Pyrinomonadaceae bacterium]|jgi:medium-chain acyl-[acyl-carrier-protein] hydrolase|nr:alpha/beta fold hydrolase [Pyrinomonadaceae bacterium]